MLSFDALGVLPKAMEKKTSFGYAYEVATQYDDCGKLKRKQVKFSGTNVPVRALTEVLEAEFMTAPIDTISTHLEDGREPKLVMTGYP